MWTVSHHGKGKSHLIGRILGPAEKSLSVTDHHNTAQESTNWGVRIAAAVGWDSHCGSPSQETQRVSAAAEFQPAGHRNQSWATRNVPSPQETKLTFSRGSPLIPSTLEGSTDIFLWKQTHLSECEHDFRFWPRSLNKHLCSQAYRSGDIHGLWWLPQI